MNSDTENPFRPPEARLDEPDATHGEPLYRLSAIGLGTFIGTPLAGAFLAAVNLRRLGRAQEVGKTWLVGLCLFVLLPVLGAILPENIPSIGFTVAQIFGMVYYADQPSVRPWTATRQRAERSFPTGGRRGSACCSCWWSCR